MAVTFGPFDLAKMERAVEKVRERLHRATNKLNVDAIPYAVIGGNAVMAWVSRVDDSAIRNTRDVDLLINRSDLPRVIKSLEEVGFIYRKAADMFLDGKQGKPREAVHIVFANEKVKEHEIVLNPDLTDSEQSNEGYRIISLEKLVQIKLTAFRIKDRNHLMDMIELGMIDSSWCAKYPPLLAERLQDLIDHPDHSL
jgi:hypothetical protein